MKDRISLEKRLKSISKEEVKLPAFEMYAEDYFDAFAQMCGDSEMLRQSYEKMITPLQEERLLRIHKIVNIAQQMPYDEKMRLLYSIFILQSISQLRSLYGEARAMAIINNFDHLLYLGGNDVDTSR